EQQAVLERSEEGFKRIAGQAPRGWRAPAGLMNRHTRRLLATRGYRYDSSFNDDHVPYIAADRDPGGASIVELPVFEAEGDEAYYRSRRPPEAVARGWREEFEA